MIIDATDLIIGRFATKAAKAALLGDEIHIINCEEAVISGDKQKIVQEYSRKRQMGIPSKGPFHHRKPEMYVKRVIRGMLPYKQAKGRAAFEKIKCHMGVPKDLEGKKTITFEEANVNKLPEIKFVKVGVLCKIAGAKI